MARGLSRREALAAGAGAVAVVATGCGGGDERKQAKPEPPKAPEWQPAGPLEGLSADTWTLRRKRPLPQMPQIPLGVYLRLENEGPEAKVLALANRCTHRGCPVRYVEASRRFICPCHGGVYGERGRVFGGPVKRPLEDFETRVYDGVVYVRNTTI